MSVTRDGNTDRWMSQVRVKDWTGKVIHKKKRGFRTKKEALQWEREYVSQATASLGMLFKDFVEIYYKDMEQRLKQTTIRNKRCMIDCKIVTYFAKRPLDSIQSTDVCKWQNSLTRYRDQEGKPYSETYTLASAWASCLP